MSVPKKRRTSSSRKRRASHHGLKEPNLSSCPECKKPILSHHACTHCGSYKGARVAATPKIKTKKRHH